MQLPPQLFSCQQNAQLSSSYLPISLLDIVTLLAVKHIQPSERKVKNKHAGEQEADKEVDEEKEGREEEAEEESEGEEENGDKDVEAGYWERTTEDG